MSTEVTTDPAPGVFPAVHPAPSGSRTAAVAGIAFAILLFVAVAAFDAPRAATDQALSAWWADPGHLHAVVLSTFAMLGAGLCFLVLAGHLQARLRAIAPASSAPPVIGLAAAVFVGACFLTGSMGALARGQLIDAEPTPGPDLLRYLPQIRYTAMGAFALPAAALLIALTSYLVLRHGGLPAWTGWLGVVCAIAIAGATATYRGQLSIPVLLLWALCVSICLLLRPATATAAARRC